MRKNKYTIEVDIIESINTGAIEITEKVYKEQVEKLLRQCNASFINGCEYEGEHKGRKKTSAFV